MDPCKCKTNCLSNKGRNACPCRMRNVKCRDGCLCIDTRKGCSNLGGNEKKNNERRKKPKTKQVPSRKLSLVVKDFSLLDKTTKEAKEPASEEVIAPASEEVIAPASEEVIAPASEEVIEPASEEVIEHTSEEMIEYASEKGIEHASEEVMESATKEAMEPATKEIECTIPTQILNMTNFELNMLMSQILKDNPTIRLEKYLGKDGPSPPDSDVLAKKLPNWCKCGNCVEMPMPDERVCCTARRNVGCVTDGRFNEICLARDLLQLQMEARRDVGAIRYHLENKNFRHAGYRQFIFWQRGILGKYQRRVIPSCAVTKIRSNYPSANGQYTGFRRVRRGVAAVQAARQRWN